MKERRILHLVCCRWIAHATYRKLTQAQYGVHMDVKEYPQAQTYIHIHKALVTHDEKKFGPRDWGRCT